MFSAFFHRFFFSLGSLGSPGLRLRRHVDVQELRRGRHGGAQGVVALVLSFCWGFFWGNGLVISIAHMLHVWNIYQHLPHK